MPREADSWQASVRPESQTCTAVCRKVAEFNFTARLGFCFLSMHKGIAASLHFVWGAGGRGLARPMCAVCILQTNL